MGFAVKLLKLYLRAVAFLLVFSSSAFAGFTNGGFETSPGFSGWTLEGYSNGGLSGGAPFSYSSINFGAPIPTNITSEVKSSTGTDPDVPAISYPKYGKRTAIVRGDFGSRMNLLKQSITLAAADMDTDGYYHIRFAYAPVAENPGHVSDEQPFFFVGVNKSGVSLYSKFYFAQNALPWVSTLGVLYMDWQYVDISSKDIAMADGDTIEVVVVAAGCSQGGHASRVYVDGFGSKSLFIEKTADKDLLYPGEDLTYTFQYANMGATAIPDVVAKETLPDKTEFVSSLDPRCSEAAKVVTCNLGTLNPGDEGTFDVTVKVGSAMFVGTVLNDMYTIEGASYPPVPGAPVTTKIVLPIHTELSITNSDNQQTYIEGQTLTYDVVAYNEGPAEATGANSPAVTFSYPPELTNVTWTCSATFGSFCAAASGVGSINDTVQILKGGNLNYTVTGTVSAIPPATITTTATITAAVDRHDDPADNIAEDTDTYKNTFNIYAVAGFGGTISPAGLTTVSLNATPSFLAASLTGFHIVDLSVDDVSVGVGPGYTFAPVRANHVIRANFAINTYKITATAGAGGTISPLGVTTLNYGLSQTYSITPQSGYRIADVFVDGKTLGAISSYTFSKIAADHTISVTFVAKTYTIYATASTGGAFAPVGSSGYTTVAEGASLKYTFTPASGYMIIDVKVNGISKGSLPFYTFTNVLANQTINVTFAPSVLMIVSSAGTGGSISPAGSNAVARGGSKTFTILPLTGYKISSVLVDGVSVGAISNYTFTNVQAAHTISASFVKNTVIAPVITSSVIGTGGTISPVGNVIVKSGQSQTFNFLPVSGYKVSVVTVNGISKGAVPSYTFPAVLINQTICVSFSKI